MEVQVQAVNMQMQAVPNQQEELKAKPDQAKKTDAEPARNGDSFLAMVKKMIAAGKDENAKENQSLSEKSAQKEAGIPEKGKNSDLKAEQGLNKVENKSDELSANAKNSFKELTQSQKMLGEENAKRADAKTRFDDEKMLNLLTKEASEEIQIKEVLPEDVQDSDKVLLFAKNENLTENLNKTLDSKKLKNKGEAKSDNEVLSTEGILAKLNKKNQTKKANSVQEGIEQAKKAPTKPNKPIISVEDMRSQLNPEMRSDSTVHKAGSETRVETENSVDMIIDFRGKADGASLGADKAGSTFSQSTAKSNQTFQSMLSQELRESAADFVQAGKIVLKDNNAGEIRLQLRPENLGAVRIKLELAEGKKVNGTVTVATKEAFDAFEENLDALAKEFEENGFDTAEFNLNWQGDSSNSQEFPEGFNAFDGFAYQSDTENLREAEKVADNLNAYSFDYGEAVNILI